MDTGSVNESEVLAAELAFEQRLRRYRELGHDREAAVRWAVDVADGLEGPILDAGTGKDAAVESARRGFRVTSVDPCQDDQHLAARRATRAGCADRVVFVNGTIESFPGAEKSFGAAAMMNVLHHLDTAEEVFDRIDGSLRPGGRLLLAEFTAEGFAVVAQAHRAEGGEHAIGPVTMETALRALSERGWSVAVAMTGHMHEVRVLQRS